ncbi:MAG TPA: type 4a pilus biogenesis protein PilO [Candidatus Angelobacter sp.]|jgi:type IV pilus assembly protein PilO|nr:type 4a pilus biogenesis protein PilO [Candidatus Angelobacter sp.]
MAKFGEMSLLTRAGILFVAALMIGAAYYYIYFNPLYQANQQLDTKIHDKVAENNMLRTYEPKLAELNRNMAILQQQMEIQKKIVPDDKDADQFIKLLHDTAATSGVNIRRYTSMPVSNHDFYTEVPFSIDIDGEYYAVLNFFARVAELERIVNVSNMQMGNTKSASAAKVKTSYTYNPNETVLASCVASTFFSHEPEETPAAAPAKPGQPAGK